MFIEIYLEKTGNEFSDKRYYNFDDVVNIKPDGDGYIIYTGNTERKVYTKIKLEKVLGIS